MLSPVKAFRIYTEKDRENEICQNADQYRYKENLYISVGRADQFFINLEYNALKTPEQNHKKIVIDEKQYIEQSVPEDE